MTLSWVKTQASKDLKHARTSGLFLVARVNTVVHQQQSLVKLIKYFLPPSIRCFIGPQMSK